MTPSFPQTPPFKHDDVVRHKVTGLTYRIVDCGVTFCRVERRVDGSLEWRPINAFELLGTFIPGSTRSYNPRNGVPLDAAATPTVGHHTRDDHPGNENFRQAEKYKRALRIAVEALHDNVHTCWGAHSRSSDALRRIKALVPTE